MVPVHLAQGDIGLAVFHRSYKAPALALSLQFLTTQLKVCIQCGQLLPEVVHRALKVVIRHKQVLLYILLFHLISGFAGQDDQFAHHVRTTEVYAWVGF